MEVIQYTVQYPICWPLGHTARYRSQNKNSKFVHVSGRG